MADDLEKAQAALEAALAELGGGIPTAWVAVVAVARADGGDTLRTVTSPGLPFWQKHGLLSQGALTTAGQPEWTYDEEDDQ